VYFVCCKILGIEPGSDIDTIKSSFRKLAKELHPDLNPSEKASQYFIILQNAYKYLLEHPYSKMDVERLLRQKYTEKLKTKISFDQAIHYRPNPLSSKTLREVLKYSFTARVLYALFHILFITMGLYLVYRPIYNIIYYPVDLRINPFGAYFVLGFGFIFGIMITTIFLFTGIKFIRNR
jgi:hypothetical protein